MRMKQLTAIVTAALLAILVAAPAFAQQPLEPRVPGDWDVADGGAWTAAGAPPSPETAAWSPQLSTQFALGDEDRGAFSIGNLTNGTSLSLGRGELSAIFYDLALVDTIPTPGGVRLQFGAAARNPLGGSNPAGTGGVVEIYENEGAASGFDTLTKVLDPNGGLDGPQDWVEGTGGARDSFDSIGGPSATASGDANHGLWLSGRFVQLTTSAGGQPVFLEQEVFADGTDSNFAVGIDLVSGSAIDSVRRDGVTIPSKSTTQPGVGKAVDMLAEVTFRGPDVSGAQSGNSSYQDKKADDANWQAHVTDPFSFVLSGTSVTAAGQTLTGTDGETISGNHEGGTSLFAPEPGAASLLGLGLLGLLAFRRKKE